MAAREHRQNKFSLAYELGIAWVVGKLKHIRNSVVAILLSCVSYPRRHYDIIIYRVANLLDGLLWNTKLEWCRFLSCEQYITIGTLCIVSQLGTILPDVDPAVSIILAILDELNLAIARSISVRLPCDDKLGDSLTLGTCSYSTLGSCNPRIALEAPSLGGVESLNLSSDATCSLCRNCIDLLNNEYVTVVINSEHLLLELTRYELNSSSLASIETVVCIDYDSERTATTVCLLNDLTPLFV